MRRLITAAGLVCLTASVIGQDRPRASLQVEQSDLQLFDQPYKALRGSRAEFFFRVPEHVAFADSELRLGLDVSTNLLPHISGIRVALNSKMIAEASWNPAAFGHWSGMVTRKMVQPGWNRIAIELTAADNAWELWNQSGAWGLWRSNTFLRLSYRRVALFPELARFPESYAEEKLLRKESAAVADIFLPAGRRNIYMRALAILGTRLGQTDYLRESEIRVRPISGWNTDAEQPSAILLAQKDELPPLPLSRDIEARKQSLVAGEGLIAEFILGEPPRQRRCLLVTGADDAGLEKALLTVGSGPALIWAPPSPVVISTAPEPRSDLAFLMRPHSGTFAFEVIGWSRVYLQGAAREATLSGWRLPPGYALGAHSRLHLNIITAANLTNSALDVLVNGSSIGQIELTPEFVNLSTARIELPPGMRGRDPMTITFRARLDSSVAWVSVLGTSRLEAHPRQLDKAQLQGLSSLLFSDAFLTKLAFAVPAESSWTELKSFFDLAMHVGRNLPSSQILWPEAVAYSATKSPESKRLHGRNVVVLGYASQWVSALPAHARLPITVDSRTETVTMQGRRYNVGRFEPDLGIAQLMTSPWDPDHVAVVAGGWKTASVLATYSLFTSPEAAHYLFGNITIIDGNGRGTAYDTRRGNSESLAERIQRDLPAGLSAQETKVRRGMREMFAAQSRAINRNVWIFAPVLLSALVGARVWFTWDQHQQRKRALASEKPLGSTI